MMKRPLIRKPTDFENVSPPTVILREHVHELELDPDLEIQAEILQPGFLAESGGHISERRGLSTVTIRSPNSTEVSVHYCQASATGLR